MRDKIRNVGLFEHCGYVGVGLRRGNRQKHNTDNFFTCDIATNESPGVKSTSPRSMTTLSNVSP